MKNPRQPPRGARSGFTALEMTLAIALLAIVAVKAFGALQRVNSATGASTSQVVVEDQARRVLQQIGYAVMGANRETLVPDAAAPLSMEDLTFQVNLGIQDGEVVWGDPEQISLDELGGAIFWSDSPGEAQQRRIVWTKLVAPFLEGELPNGMDDNGNGLIDEKGLSFVVDRNAVTIRLTLTDTGKDGQSVTRTVQTTVTCRNIGEPAT